jgi:2-polyprenyl-3-methyl-5-hydroxy-6-metoxy-1,4-benzoquinol methylase
MKKSDIFRNTENYYLKFTDYASNDLLGFVLENAGNDILDVGCATGDYCVKLKKLGFNCTGIDINKKYVEKAIENKIESYLMSADDLKFPDNSFDTILLFEVLEHVENPSRVIEEVKRVAKKNILITVPNNTEFYELRKYGLTYEHMLEKDHINFFTKKDLENMLSTYFKEFEVEKKEAVNYELINLPSWLRYPISILYKLKIIRHRVYFRLYAIAAIK